MGRELPRKKWARLWSDLEEVQIAFDCRQAMATPVATQRRKLTEIQKAAFKSAAELNSIPTTWSISQKVNIGAIVNSLRALKVAAGEESETLIDYSPVRGLTPTDDLMNGLAGVAQKHLGIKREISNREGGEPSGPIITFVQAVLKEWDAGLPEEGKRWNGRKATATAIRSALRRIQTR